MRAPFAFSVLGSLAVLALLSSNCLAQTMWVDLEPASSGGTHAMSPVKLSLSSTRPPQVTKEPAYRYHPQYGTVHLGDAAENSITVVLDTDKNVQRPVLYVDANGNGDLTDESPLSLAPAIDVVANQFGEKSVKTHEGELVGNAVVTARYAIAGRGGMLDSTLQFSVWDGDVYVNRSYSRAGKLVIDGRTYRVALVDQRVDGKFSGFKHAASDPAAVSLLIDKNGNGVFDLPQEAYDAGRPFILNNARYHVLSIDVRGTHVVLERMTPSSAGVDPRSLANGTRAIAFDSDTTDGVGVSFPSDFKNKVVLLDFWATWCPPCREEIPTEVQTYNQFHGKGFEIVGVSLDQPGKGRDLADFCKTHEMPWTEVYDGGDWQAALAVMYGIRAIPQAYLVDGNTGTILAMGDELRGEGLTKAVSGAVANLKKQ